MATKTKTLSIPHPGSVSSALSSYEGYSLTTHAGQRMNERQISAADIREVLGRPTWIEHGDRPELLNLRSTIRGRALRVTVNAITDSIVTVAEDRRHSCSSTFGWFTLGAAVGVRV